MLKAIKKYLGWFARAIRPYRGSVWAIIGCHVLLTVSSLAFIILTKNLIVHNVWIVKAAYYVGNY